MEIDANLGYWIDNVPYEFDGYSMRDCRRKYFLHENSIVYDSSGQKVELYATTHEPYENFYIFDPLRFPECAQYFQVMNPYTVDMTKVHLNGKKVKLTKESSYIQLWKLATYNRTYCGPLVAEGYVIPLETTCNSRYAATEPYTIPKNLLRKAQNYDWQKIMHNNPKIPTRKYRPVIDEMPNDFPRKKWSSREKPKPPNTHWGQLKLLLSEMKFLNTISQTTPSVVVYAGAAAGYHIPFLSKLFHNLLFILYDPADFGIKPTPNIIIRKEFFTTDVAKLYDGMNIVFVSDIRLSHNDPKQFEKMVHENNLAVKDWLRAARPKNSSLKFRFPFDWEGDYNYVTGEIHVQEFAPATSAETRLFVDGDVEDTQDYDIKSYEEQMFYFNTEYRNRSFLDRDPVFGIDFDTFSMFEIFREYLIQHRLLNRNDGREIMWSKVAAMMLDMGSVMRGKNLQKKFEWLR